MPAHVESVAGAWTRLPSAAVESGEASTERPISAFQAVRLRDRRARRYLALADGSAALVALVVCAWVGETELSPTVLLGLPLVVLACKLSGLYSRDPLVVRRATLDELPALFRLAGLYTLVVWLLDDTLLRADMQSLQALVLWGSVTTGTALSRRCARGAVARASQTERLLLLGDAPTYTRLAAKLEGAGVDAQLVGRMSLQRISRISRDREADEDSLRAIVSELDVHRVLVVPSASDPYVTHETVRCLKAVGVPVSIVPSVLDVVGTGCVMDDVGGLTMLGVPSPELSASSRLIKRAIDLIGASLGLVAFAPPMVLIALAIRLDSRGPAIFRQTRIGQGGRPLRVYKFRTMVADAEDRKPELQALNEAHGLFKIASDPRVTRVGALLRRTALDELPQLFNVLRGEMSLVGPRPLIACEDETICGHDRRRLLLKPGMTGPWQIQGSARVPMREMVRLDYLYVTTWTVFEDFKILVRTIPFVARCRGM